MTSQAIIRIARGCRRLRVLSLVGCKATTTESVAHILRHTGSSLREIWLGECRKVIALQAFSRAAKDARQLQVVDLSYGPKLCDAFVGLIARACPSLHTLNLNGAAIDVSPSALAAAAAFLPLARLSQTGYGLEPGHVIARCTDLLSTAITRTERAGWAVVRLQSRWRGHIAKWFVLQVRQARENLRMAQRQAAAIPVQAAARRFLCRRAYLAVLA